MSTIPSLRKPNGEPTWADTHGIGTDGENFSPVSCRSLCDRLAMPCPGLCLPAVLGRRGAVFDEPEAGKELRVDRVAGSGAGEQPRAGFNARHFVYHDVLGLVAATRADFLQTPCAHEGDHLGAHAG